MVQLYPLRTLSILLLVLAILICLTNAYSPNLRGVPLDKVSLYAPRLDKNWVCLDNKKMLKHDQINDDYCDCADGSDEPGTSACSNGRFNCANIGHRAEGIHSSRVNDGICDCCDGSDEWADGSGNCQNTCLERGRVEEELRRSKAELHQQGSAKRSELIARGKQLRAEREDRRKALVQERNEQEAVKAEKDELKRHAEVAEAEALEFYKEQRESGDVATEAKSNSSEDAQKFRYEAEAAFVKYDTNNDGYVEITELMVDMTFDRDRNGVVTVEEVKNFIDDERLDLSSFCTLFWPRIKPLKVLNDDIFKPPIPEGEEHPPQESPDQLSNEEVNEQEGAEENFNDEVELYEDEEADVDGNLIPQEIEYDPETMRLIDLANNARNVYSAAEQKVRQIELEIKNIDDQVSKDFGPNEEFASLDGECFTYEDREYVYELCPFNRAVQKPRSGGLETILGRWDQWIGDGDRKYKKQKYAHGAACWNGPKRSCIVHFICGLEHKITSVTEPNRCEYNYVFETPAACCDNVSIDKQQHDEL